MSKYVASDPTQNATLEQAKGLVSQRALVALPSYGIFAQAQGSQEIVPEADFGPNKIDGTKPACLLIKWADRPDREDSASVPASDDYINVGEVLEALAKAPNLRAAVVSMIDNELTQSDVVFQPGEAERRIDDIPAVAFASNAAFEKAWAVAGGVKPKPVPKDEPPPVDPGGGRG